MMSDMPIEPPAILPDVLEPGLRVVFCGTAAGKASARAGAYYAGPGNAFWPTLHEVGLTPRRLEPGEFRELPRYGIGLTDMCKLRSGSDAEVGTDGFDVGRLVAALDEYAPAWIAFTSKNAGRAALGGTGTCVTGASWPRSLGRNRHTRRGFRDSRLSILVLDGARACNLDRRAAR